MKEWLSHINKKVHVKGLNKACVYILTGFDGEIALLKTTRNKKLRTHYKNLYHVNIDQQ
jgi:hypothetical protein